MDVCTKFEFYVQQDCAQRQQAQGHMLIRFYGLAVSLDRLTGRVR
jgi:hypothetical protein